MGIEIKNDAIEKSLKMLAAKNEKVYKKALKNGAEIMAEALRDNSPFDPVTNLHLENYVAISNVKDDGTVEIGYTKKVYWRVAFVEFGTINQPPQHFMEDTFKETNQKTIEKVVEELKKGLKI